MDGNNIFLIEQNLDGSFTNVPFNSAGINVSENNLTFLSENISFLSTGVRLGEGGSVLAPISRIFGNPIHFSGQGQVNFGNERRSPYISFYNSDSNGNVLDIQKAKRIASGPFIRRAYNDYLINAKDGDGIPVFAVKHFYTYSLPGPPGVDKGRPYIGIFCNPDDTIPSTFASIPYSVTISGHPTFGANIRFYGGPKEAGGIKQKIVSYKNDNLYITRNDNEGYDQIDFQIDNSGYILMNGNPSFGRYSYAADKKHNLIGKKNSNNLIENALEHINITGIQDTNILNIYSVQSEQSTNYPILAKNYMMVDLMNGVNPSKSTIIPNSGLYSGKGFKAVKTHPSIGNHYFNLNLESGSNQAIKPYPKYIETFVNITVPSGKGNVRPLKFIKPTTHTVNNPVINLKFNFSADDNPCLVSGYSEDTNQEIFLITGGNYSFVQTERLIFHKGANGEAFIRW